MRNEETYQQNRSELVERRMKEQPMEVAFILRSLAENGPEKTDEILKEAIELYRTDIKSLISNEYVSHILKILIDQNPKNLEKYIKLAEEQYREMIKRGLVNGGATPRPCCTSCLGLA